MRLFAVAYYVQKVEKYQVHADLILARDKESALGFAYYEAYRIFPPDKGWYGHQCAITPANEDEIIKALTKKDEENDG